MSVDIDPNNHPCEELTRVKTQSSNSGAMNEAIENVPMNMLDSYTGYFSPRKAKFETSNNAKATSTVINKNKSDDVPSRDLRNERGSNTESTN